ncbi:MAG: type 1 glutamine amidotransferase [Bacteroidia bacterium]
MIRIHIFLHAAFEGPGYIAQWANEQGHTLSYTRWYEGGRAPETSDYDWLVIMGGPMSVHDTGQYNWLQPELNHIDQAIKQGKIVLGFCLGSQLIAKTLGATVSRNAEKEIGWHEVSLSKQALNLKSFQAIPEKMQVFHWHGETYTLPDSSLPLFSSKATALQGFIYRDRVIALQFHPEVLLDDVEAMIANGQTELREQSAWIQSEQAMRDGVAQFASNGQLLLSHLFGLLSKSRAQTSEEEGKPQGYKFDTTDFLIKVAVVVPGMLLLRQSPRYQEMHFLKELLIVTILFAIAHGISWLFKRAKNS